MNKTIIGIYGRASEGKSETIKAFCQELTTCYPNAIASTNPINYSQDILVTIQLGNVKIGIESQGDPNSRMINEDTIRRLADPVFDPILGGCDIIVCATRTEGMTTNKVDGIANIYGYHTLWISSFWSPTLDKRKLNRFAALNLVSVVKSLILGKL